MSNNRTCASRTRSCHKAARSSMALTLETRLGSWKCLSSRTGSLTTEHLLKLIRKTYSRLDPRPNARLSRTRIRVILTIRPERWVCDHHRMKASPLLLSYLTRSSVARSYASPKLRCWKCSLFYRLHKICQNAIEYFQLSNMFVCICYVCSQSKNHPSLIIIPAS